MLKIKKEKVGTKLTVTLAGRIDADDEVHDIFEVTHLTQLLNVV